LFLPGAAAGIFVTEACQMLFCFSGDYCRDGDSSFVGGNVELLSSLQNITSLILLELDYRRDPPVSILLVVQSSPRFVFQVIFEHYDTLLYSFLLTQASAFLPHLLIPYLSFPSPEPTSHSPLSILD